MIVLHVDDFLKLQKIQTTCFYKIIFQNKLNDSYMDHLSLVKSKFPQNGFYFEIDYLTCSLEEYLTFIYVFPEKTRRFFRRK